MGRACKAIAITLPLLAVLLLGSRGQPVAADGHSYLGPDGKVDKNQNCIDCHTYEYKAWQRTHHHNSKEEGESDLAFELTIELDLDEMRETPLCAQCHFTAVDVGGQTRHYGVTCESCHGAASGWAPLHNKPWEELDGISSREDKLRALEERGMIRPGRLYDLAQNCFQCHIMAKDGDELSVEQLVNLETAEGQHPASSPGFELVSWSHGEVRHNFRTPDNNEDPTNPASDHPRAMYVVGKLLDLEYSLRALALATEPDGRFAASLRGRIEGEPGALAALDAISTSLPDGHPVKTRLASLLPLARAVEEPVAVADAIREQIAPLFNGVLADWPLAKLEESLAPVAGLVPQATQGEVWRPE